MRQTIKTSFSVLASVALLSVSGATFARGGHHHHGGGAGTVTRLVASLTPAGANLGSGVVSYKSDTTSGNATLHVSLNLPIDGTVIPDLNTAAANAYVLTDTTTGTVCNLAIQEIDFIPAEAATYIAQDAVNGTTFSGAVCSGSATLAAGDAITITLSSDPSTSVFSGTLAAFPGF